MWRCGDLTLTDVSEECIASIFSHLLTLVPRSRIFLPWRWRRYVPPKRRLTQDLHSATFQKTTFFIVTAVTTSNLTNIVMFPLFSSSLNPPCRDRLERLEPGTPGSWIVVKCIIGWALDTGCYRCLAALAALAVCKWNTHDKRLRCQSCQPFAFGYTFEIWIWCMQRRVVMAHLSLNHYLQQVIANLELNVE
jgi:hypothetical protein